MAKRHLNDKKRFNFKAKRHLNDKKRFNFKAKRHLNDKKYTFTLGGIFKTYI